MDSYEQDEARAYADYRREKRDRILDHIPEDEGTLAERKAAADKIAMQKADAAGVAGRPNHPLPKGLAE